MRVIETFEYLCYDVYGMVDGYQGLSCQRASENFFEIATFNELHGDIVCSFGFSQVIDLYDVGMGEAADNLGFVDEHDDEFSVIGEVWKDPFDDQMLFESPIRTESCAKNLCHTADGDSFQQFVFSKRDGFGSAFQGEPQGEEKGSGALD